MDEKSMQFANFNITFGENDAPMLKHFSDIIFPAFSVDYIRGKRDSVPRYFFAGVEIKEVDNEYVMVGNFIIEASNPVPTPLLGHRCRSSQEITGSPTPFSTSNHYLWICESASFSLSNPNIAA